MEKYRLKKLYPGLPEGWEVGDICRYSRDTYTLVNVYKKTTNTILPKWIENQPEFWEKVGDVDYQVLCYICLGSNKRFNGQLFKLQQDGLYHWRSVKYSEEEIKEYPYNYEYGGYGYIIHSVKRLSDGEIFAVGDKTNNGIISRFEIHTIGIRVYFEEKPKNYHVGLDSIKQPLFTTVDGFDMYDGHQYYPVCVKEGFSFKAFEFIPQLWTGKVPKGFVAFKYEENARMYARLCNYIKTL